MIWHYSSVWDWLIDTTLSAMGCQHSTAQRGADVARWTTVSGRYRSQPILFKALQSRSLLPDDAPIMRRPAAPPRSPRPDAARLRSGTPRGNPALIADELRLVNWRAEKGEIGFLINLVGITGASPAMASNRDRNRYSVENCYSNKRRLPFT